MILRVFEETKRPLSQREKDRYLTEQAVIGRMGGAEWVPETMRELHDYVERMRPLMSMNEQTRRFINFLAGDSAGEFGVSKRKQLDNRLGLAASMTLMPVWARQLTGTYLPELVQRAYLGPNTRLQTRVVRWAYPELPCRAMASARAAGAKVAAEAAA
jgi:uncharacterized protein (DUF2236 family)